MFFDSAPDEDVQVGLLRGYAKDVRPIGSLKSFNFLTTGNGGQLLTPTGDNAQFLGHAFIRTIAGHSFGHRIQQDFLELFAETRVMERSEFQPSIVVDSMDNQVLFELFESRIQFQEAAMI